MGWGRMLLLGDWGQQMDLADQQREIEELRDRIAAGSATRSTDLGRRIADLQQQNDELRLYLAAVVRLLGSKGLINKAELTALIDTIDAEDGQADGGYTGPIA